MKYTILKTNDNNTADVEFVFEEYNDYSVVASNIPLGDSEMDLENNIIDQARVIRDELSVNLATPYEPTIGVEQTIELE